jgi:tetratricopeptide (TPR) repeat protein
MVVSKDVLERESVGERLLRLRHERGLSQQQLAGSGLSTAQVSRIEAGKRQPSVRAIRLLARELRVSPEYLETGHAMTTAESLELRLADVEVRIRFGENPNEVLAVLEGVFHEIERTGNPVLLARALADLGSVAASQGRNWEAVSLLERAVETGDVHPATHPHVFTALARTYWLLDDYERYANLMESCLQRLAECPSEETAAARTTYMTQLSYALSCLGEFDRARDLLLQVSEEEEQRADLYGRARLYWSLARLSGTEGKLSSALEYARRSIALLETCEDDVHLGRAHLLCGLIFNLDDRAEEASKQLDLAEALLGPRIEPIDLGQLRAEQAKSLAELGDAERALAYAQEAARLLESDPDYLGSAWHALAKAYAVRGDADEACAYYEKAAECLESDRSGWREAVQACRGWALVLREAGRRDDAARVFGRAAEITRRETSRATATESK